MGKISVALPEVFVFSTDISIRAADINYGGHLGNVQIIGLLDEARVRFFQFIEHKDGDLGGVHTIMAGLEAEFKGEGFWGDTIQVEVAIGNFTTKAFDVFYKLVNKETGKAVANARTTLVAFNYTTREVSAIPISFMEKIEGLNS